MSRPAAGLTLEGCETMCLGGLLGVTCATGYYSMSLPFACVHSLRLCVHALCLCASLRLCVHSLRLCAFLASVCAFIAPVCVPCACVHYLRLYAVRPCGLQLVESSTQAHVPAYIHCPGPGAMCLCQHSQSPGPQSKRCYQSHHLSPEPKRDRDGPVCQHIQSIALSPGFLPN